MSLFCDRRALAATEAGIARPERKLSTLPELTGISDTTGHEKAAGTLADQARRKPELKEDRDVP
jgi:hypothetical protein